MLLWCNVGVAADVSYLCYEKVSSLKLIEKRNSKYGIGFAVMRFSVSANGTVFIEYDRTYFSKNSPAWDLIYYKYDESFKISDLEERQKKLNDLNPFKTKLSYHEKFKPIKKGKEFFDIRHAAGGRIETVRVRSASELGLASGSVIDAPNKYVEYWQFDLNVPKAIYNEAFTPEYVNWWNAQPDEEGGIKFKKLSTEPFTVIEFEVCEPEGQSASTETASSGTAFFINKKGYLLTNNHVVEGCKVSKINYFNKEYDTELITTDKTLDLALLKSEVRPKSFITFSKDEPKKRQPITIAGYPLGEGLSDDLKINDGRISALKGFENNSNEITVDIAINPGNSGGPIVNEKGQLVAIAVSGMSKDVTEGINFGIKVSAVANFLKSNKISPSTGYMSFSTSGDKLVKLLEESTVYTFCE